jgi:8-oxo-dGTP pyrophosphatase MutT (NUDIX family)
VRSRARSCFRSASSLSIWSPERLRADQIPAASQIAADQTPTGHIRAAVLVPLFPSPDGDGPHVVLTRRRADLRRHAGEISFPGGRQDPDDADLRDTALREAEEEIGLRRTEVSLLGELPPTATFATNYVIHPFVGVISAPRRWRPSPLEVDAVIELPLRALREGRARTRLERRGLSFETDAYIVGEHLIWGATARILENLLVRLRASHPDGRLSLA